MRPLRNKDPGLFRLITARTQEARLWIQPNRDVSRLIGGIVARYQEIYQIEVYAYCVLSNHMHLLIRAPEQNTDLFCENVNREISRRINWRLKRQGSFWGRRYSDEEVKTQADLLDAFLYVNTNPCNHGLVRSADQWPGLTSCKQVLSGSARRFSFYHYSATGNQPKITSHKLTITPLPQFTSYSKSKRASKFRTLIEEREHEIEQQRTSNNQGYLGLEQLCEQEVGAIPRNVAKKNRPVCYTKDHKVRKQHAAAEQQRRKAYRAASRRFRLGELSTKFPDYTYRPPLHRVPKPTPIELTIIQGLKSD